MSFIVTLGLKKGTAQTSEQGKIGDAVAYANKMGHRDSVTTVTVQRQTGENLVDVEHSHWEIWGQDGYGLVYASADSDAIKRVLDHNKDRLTSWYVVKVWE